MRISERFKGDSDSFPLEYWNNNNFSLSFQASLASYQRTALELHLQETNRKKSKKEKK